MKTQIRLTKASLNGIDVAPISLELTTELYYTAVLADIVCIIGKIWMLF